MCKPDSTTTTTTTTSTASSKDQQQQETNNNKNTLIKKESDDQQQQQSNKIVISTIPSGFPEYRNRMCLWFIGFTLLYFGTIQYFDSINHYLQLPPSDPKLCPNIGEACWRADLFSFEVVSGVALMWCGIMGLWNWHFVEMKLPDTPEGRLFGYLPSAHSLTAVGTTFQLFDLFISLLIPEQCQPLMLCHHIMAALVSWYGLNNQYFHYYAVFYLGCSEISTIPLVFIDLAKFFPPTTPGTTYDVFIGAVCGPLFAVTFTYYRVIAWWQTSRLLFQDSLYVLQTRSPSSGSGSGSISISISNQVRPNRNHVIYVTLTLNVVLGCLQLYWFRMILQEVFKVVFGIDIPQVDEQEEL